MNQNNFLINAAVWIFVSAVAQAGPMSVKHIQRPMHQLMVLRSVTGNIIAKGEFSQIVQGDEVTMHLVYHFLDGSLDDETTTYRQQAKFQLVRDHHIQEGPFFTRPIDFEVDTATSSTTNWTTDKEGSMNVNSRHMDLPADVANGFIGTLVLNAPQNGASFRTEMVVPFNGGRLVRLSVSREGQKPFQMAGRTLTATVYRVHPELGGIIGMIASMLGLKPKDVMVWVQQAEEPAVVRVVGQLGGYGPVVSSDVEGTSYDK
jgi:hypothetical protein